MGLFFRTSLERSDGEIGSARDDVMDVQAVCQGEPTHASGNSIGERGFGARVSARRPWLQPLPATSAVATRAPRDRNHGTGSW
jgi:hypothetical protein